ncbi:hypothetical protein O3P69_010371 [Scylla paramamosain]|uniref:Uncharacterized protein n=1 Tax=Scylla paramamosain TaxID=85552 RepID=A0AAW0TST3_SCYPA
MVHRDVVFPDRGHEHGGIICKNRSPWRWQAGSQHVGVQCSRTDKTFAYKFSTYTSEMASSQALPLAGKTEVPVGGPHPGEGSCPHSLPPSLQPSPPWNERQGLGRNHSQI